MTDPSPSSPTPAPAEHSMRCPQCGGKDLRVWADLVCRVAPRAYDSPPPDGPAHYDALEPVKGVEPYWDRDSFTQCQECDHDGRVKDFEPEEAHG